MLHRRPFQQAEHEHRYLQGSEEHTALSNNHADRQANLLIQSVLVYATAAGMAGHRRWSFCPL